MRTLTTAYPGRSEGSHMALTKGTRVRFTSNSLGVINPENPYRFLEWHVGTGDEGRYLAPDPRSTVDDWHSVEVERDGKTYIVPCHRSMFEPVKTAEEKAALRKQSDILNGFAADALRKLS